MKRLTIVGSAIALAGGWQLAQAQPPGGGGGAFAQMSFDAINMADENGNKDDHLTLEEVRAFFEEAFAGFGGGGPPGGGGGPGAGGPGGGDFIADIFGRWDADENGMVTETEFDERPRGGPGGPPGGGGGPPQQ